MGFYEIFIYSMTGLIKVDMNINPVPAILSS